MSNPNDNRSIEELEQILAKKKQQVEEEKKKRKESNNVTYELTELGNGIRFTGRYKNEIVYVPEQGRWFYWKDVRWVQDDEGYAIRLFDNIIADIKIELENLNTQLKELQEGTPEHDQLSDIVDAFKKWNKTCQKLSTINNSLTLAASRQGMTVPFTDFDSEGHYLGCQNGIVDLRTGKLITGDRSYRITKTTNANYDPDAECPEWNKFLLRIMNGKEENVLFLQRMIGQGMFGHQGKDKLPILWGGGSNGKSTLVDTINDVLGDYCTVTDPKLLLEDAGKKEYYMAPLKGIRTLIMNETKKGDKIAEGVVKMLVDGGEIPARYPAGRVFTFQVVFTPILCTNHKPRVGSDYAIWRRILLVPFTYKFKEEEKNPRFRTEVLGKEKDGILKWCIDGAMMYLKDGLQPTGDIIAATEQYQQDQDKVGTFISQRCVPGENLRMTLSDMRQELATWCLDNGLEPIGSPTLKEELLGRGIEVRPSTNHVDWVYGIAAKPIGREEADEIDDLLHDMKNRRKNN